MLRHYSQKLSYWFAFCLSALPMLSIAAGSGFKLTIGDYTEAVTADMSVKEALDALQGGGGDGKKEFFDKIRSGQQPLYIGQTEIKYADDENKPLSSWGLTNKNTTFTFEALKPKKKNNNKNNNNNKGAWSTTTKVLLGAGGLVGLVAAVTLSYIYLVPESQDENKKA